VATRVSRYLGAAAEAVDEEDPEEAKRLLNKLRPKRLNPYERVLVYRMLAYVSYGQDEFEEAIKYFKKVLDEEMLPIRDEAKVRFYIAQLYASIQQWQLAIDWLNRWLVYVEAPDPLGYYLMGIASYQLQDFDAAISHSKQAIELSEEPRESWMRLLAALYSQQQDYEHAIPVLEELVLRFPKKQYWVQLSLLYGAREDYRVSLAVQQAAHTQGLLTEDKELRRLARSYLYHDLPYPAARCSRRPSNRVRSRGTPTRTNCSRTAGSPPANTNAPWPHSKVRRSCRTTEICTCVWARSTCRANPGAKPGACWSGPSRRAA
jgi:tetratricopeptide (TPR) repeat protein